MRGENHPPYPVDGLIDLWGETYNTSEKNVATENGKKLVSKLRAVHLVAMSFCGVLTPPYVYLDENGGKSFRFSQRDLLGVELLKKYRYRVMVLSNRHAVVQLRCQRMGIDCFAADRVVEAQGKDGLLRHILYGTDIFESQVMYIGDEINDLKVMNMAGVAIAVRDAHPEVKAVADYITSARGGEHAVREVAELLLTVNDYKLEL